MFKSKIHPRIIPQYEHGKLAGLLASLWGNVEFDRPALDFAAFVNGVVLHDWGYRPIDNLPLGDISETAWLAVARRGIEHRFENPISDIVVKLHIKRLLGLHDTPERSQLAAQVEGYVNERLPETGHTRADFDWADKITKLCDNIAFIFSFEKPTQGVTPVCPKVGSKETIPLTYTLEPAGLIRVDPWPFSVESYSGLLIGYHETGYPDLLFPETIPFRLVR